MITKELVKEKKKKEAERLYTIDEYFELEEKSVHKNEFVNGRIIPVLDVRTNNRTMAGGTFNHMILSSMLCTLLTIRFLTSNKDITVVSNDFKIHIPEHDRIVYADGSVVIGNMEMSGKGSLGYSNPTVIIEVLSKSTEQYDRSGKFRMYQSLPSFKEYVLVNQYTPVVEVFLKIEDNKWQVTSYIGLDKVVKLETLDVALKMSDIYKKAKDLQDPQFAIDFPEKEQK